LAIKVPQDLTIVGSDGIEKMDIQNLYDSSRLQTVLASDDSDVRLICVQVRRYIVASFGGPICQIDPGTSYAVTMDPGVGTKPFEQRARIGFTLIRVAKDSVISQTARTATCKRRQAR
jgi:hypothetical protein